METEKDKKEHKERSLEELIEENKNLNALIQNVPGGVMCCSADMDNGLELLEYSDGFLKLLGYTAEELKEKYDNKFCSIIYEEDWEATAKSVGEQMSRGSTKKIEYRVKCGDGTLKMIYDQGQLVRRNGYDVYYCILSDVTEQRAVTEALRLSLERHQIIMEQTRDIIFEWDVEKDSVMWSDNWKEKFGYQAFSTNVEQELLENGHIYPEDRETLMQLYYKLVGNATYEETEIRIQRIDGVFIWCRIRASLQLGASGDKKKVIGVIIDIDNERQEAEKLKERAEKDALTGVYNKGTVQMLGDQYLSKMKRGEMAAFFMIDIDDFKYINDVYGHLSGDVILAEIAAGLKRIFRSGDIIGRIGGDEFAVIMKDIREVDAVERKAQEVIGIFNHLLEEDKYTFSSSIGIAFAPKHGYAFETMYKKADIALYKAKAEGKNTWRFYEEGLKMESSIGNGYSTQRKADNSEEMWQGEAGIVSYIFSSLYESEDVRRGIEDILNIVGTQFGVSRAYIFEDTEDGAATYNTFEWCREGIGPQKEELQGVPGSVLGDYYSNFNANGLLYCRDIRELDEPLRELLEKQGIKSMLQCLIMDKGEKKGFVGFDECETNRLWTKQQIDTLSVISQVISVFLRKERAQEALCRLVQGMPAEAAEDKQCMSH
ncbi:diguanylate cyclase [Clostridium sp. AF19-22AC]|jgi:diguanylate cyclase (GGDEF)-like protein/PAS domain S-box-containing protein|uniref:sensor domain-containing diguanylate cyclase n=1 Tax=Clostridia TaxID=186801 RepID=UPI000E51EB94|nr:MULTISPECIES: sensor domain-containing diguanylate cyclase [Clostridia]RHR30808.1 diguanylate cyclase [Clostridium sp. AF19-22AC]